MTPDVKARLHRFLPLLPLALLSLLLIAPIARAQETAAAKFETIFENDLVVVHGGELKAHQSLPNVESAHDTFWIALNEGTLRFVAGNSAHTDVVFAAGDTRFFPSFDVNSVSNVGESPVGIVFIALKPRALIGNACDCSGASAKFLCGCKGAHHLESLWALGLGNVTLAGSTLAAGESFRSAPERDDMLLVAITNLELNDEAAEENNSVKLDSGQATWVRSGRHQFKNVGAAPARFVTFEF